MKTTFSVRMETGRELAAVLREIVRVVEAAGAREPLEAERVSQGAAVEADQLRGEEPLFLRV